MIRNIESLIGGEGVRLVTILSILLLITAGCSDSKPFLYSYELHTIHPNHQQTIDPWLQAAKKDPEIKIHSFETDDGYKYSYVKGYKDVEVSYLHTQNTGQLKQRFIKGSDQDEILVAIKYNPSICCSTNIYETEDN